jgi:hypothetical protein
MNPRNTGILALLAAALGAFLWFYEIRGAEERSRAEEAEKRVFPAVESDGVAWLSLWTTDGQAARIERTDSGWQLSEPVAFPADTLAVDGMAQALADLVSEAVFDEPESLDNYGLDVEPGLRFGFGDQEYGLRIGDKAPVGGTTYVTDAAGERVFAVSSFRTNAFDKTLSQLRDGRVADFDRDTIRHVTVRWPGGHATLEKPDQAWKLLEPLADDADTDTLEGLLSDLSYLRAADYLDEPGEDASLGLAEPTLQVELRTEASAEPLTVVVGAAREGDRRVVRGPAGYTYEVAQGALDTLPRSLGAFRFKELAQFAAGDAERLELVLRQSDEAPLALQGVRAEAGWTLSPAGMDPDKITRLVSELASLEGLDVAADAMGESERAALGLAPPRAELRVFGAGEGDAAPLLADVRLGALEPDRGIAAQRADREAVYWLDASLAEHLPIGLEAFRNRFEQEVPPEPAAASAAEPGTEAPATGD